jgi:Bacterial HORMA domain 2
MSAVAVNTYTHSVTYVTDNILKSLKDIIRLSGLQVSKLMNDWSVLHAGIKRWIESGDLEHVTVEIYHPTTDDLIYRWDINMVYTWSASGDGNFWTDTDQLRYAILKKGLAPSQANYEVKVRTKPGRPHVPGWSSGTYRSTDGMVRQSLGTTVEHNGLGATTSYWRHP